MKTILILSLVFLACKQDNVVAVNKCGAPCYPGPEAQAKKGICHAGYWSCQDGQEPVCINYQLPADEVCDGLDNDCDGQVDNKIPAVICTGPCSDQGYTGCVNGATVCQFVRAPSPEVCDGIDNDCDGKVDEPEDLPVKFCYSGPHGTAGIGICHPGAIVCQMGKEVCSGEQAPRAEACNGLDDDCNGVADDTPSTYDVDIVLVFDNSGSMAQYAPTIQTAVKSWIQKYSMIPYRRYALVTAPDNDENTYGSNPHLYQDFTDVQGIVAAIDAQKATMGSGTEPTLDALNQITDTNNPLGLSWHQGFQKAIIVFSDEMPQGYAAICMGSCAPTCSGSCNAESTLLVTRMAPMVELKLNVFTSIHDPAVVYPWNTLVTAARGSLYPVDESESQLEADLDKVIRQATCQ